MPNEILMRVGEIVSIFACKLIKKKKNFYQEVNTLVLNFIFVHFRE